MDSIDSELAARIRTDIVRGSYDQNARLSEAQFCEAYSVSRTPVRLALRLLEREGFIRKSDGRGYYAISPTVADIAQAVQVRGHLESLAARLMSQSPGRHNILPKLEAAIDEIERLIAVGKLDDGSLRLFQHQNAAFHQTILEGCGNDFVGFTCNQISHLPMLEVGAMVFDRQVLSTPEGVERSLFRLKLGNAQHRVIFEAIQKGDAVRAESVMREHANTMFEYIEVFEKRNEAMTVSDLISYSGVNVAKDALAVEAQK